MFVNPLSCSKEFLIAHTTDFVVQSVQTPSKFPFLISAIVGQNLCYTPLGLTLFYPSTLIDHLANNYKIEFGKIAWLSPALGMPLLTLAGRAAFECMPHPILKGLVYGVHSCAMGMLTNIPNGIPYRMITLRKVLGVYAGFPAALEPLSKRGLNTTLQRSEILASVAFITATLGLGFFGGFHVITANLIAHTVATVTNVVSARIFAVFAEKKQQLAAA